MSTRETHLKKPSMQKQALDAHIEGLDHRAICQHVSTSGAARSLLSLPSVPDGSGCEASGRSVSVESVGCRSVSASALRLGVLEGLRVSGALESLG
jgi:hypothetical protein